RRRSRGAGSAIAAREPAVRETEQRDGHRTRVDLEHALIGVLMKRERARTRPLDGQVLKDFELARELDGARDTEIEPNGVAYRRERDLISEGAGAAIRVRGDEPCRRGRRTGKGKRCADERGRDQEKQRAGRRGGLHRSPPGGAWI